MHPTTTKKMFMITRTLNICPKDFQEIVLLFKFVFSIFVSCAGLKFKRNQVPACFTAHSLTARQTKVMGSPALFMSTSVQVCLPFLSLHIPSVHTGN